MSEQDHDRTREFVRELTDIQPALRSFVGYLMNGNSAVPDVVQEVNLILWEKNAQFEPGTNFRAWAFNTARYVVLGHRRRLRREGALVFDSDLIERLADEWQEQPCDLERKLAALETCLEKLAEPDLSLVKARYGGHGAVGRMADTQGKSAVSLRLRLFRLRAALKQCVRRELEIEEGLA
ncbi:MAG: sigma-70 family RNA polymerase sigma factor [Akkermansiaceae bacterium]|jgi:RNA polymerase sigma-70 factor (ECF subfamily)|nr:sigma-70 family RNA polymerase sigma factor [Akkermansiaceae bacterium]